MSYSIYTKIVLYIYSCNLSLLEIPRFQEKMFYKLMEVLQIDGSSASFDWCKVLVLHSYCWPLWFRLCGWFAREWSTTQHPPRFGPILSRHAFVCQVQSMFCKTFIRKAYSPTHSLFLSFIAGIWRPPHLYMFVFSPWDCQQRLWPTTMTMMMNDDYYNYYILLRLDPTPSPFIGFSQYFSVFSS